MVNVFPTEGDRRKRACLEELLETGTVMVHVDARRPGVEVPPHLAGEVALPLNLSHRFCLDVFELGPKSIRASLSFQGERCLCVLPWGSVFSMTRHVDGKCYLFPDDVPAELHEALRTALETAGDEPAPPAPLAAPPDDDRGPTLRLLK